MTRRDRAATWLQHNILALVCTSFITGAGLARLQPSVPVPVYLGAMVLLAGLALLLHRRAKTAALTLTMPLFLLLGLLHTGHHLQPPAEQDHIYNLVDKRQKLTLTGTLATMVEYDGHTSRLVLDVEEVRFHTTRPARASAARGLVRLAIRSQVSSLEPGALLMVVATVNRIHNYNIPGAFDYRLHMASRQILVSGWIDAPARILQIVDHDRTALGRLRYLPQRIRQRINRFLEQNLDSTTGGMYRALLVGSRAGLTDQIQEQFKATGTMHLLAISGMHMGLLSILLSLAIGWLLKRSRWLLLHTHVPTLSLVATLPLLIFYAFIAGMNIPVLRALVMAVLFLVAVLVQRRHTLVPLVAFTALLTLALRPLALFTASFQLSFSAVLALSLAYPGLAGLLGTRETGGRRILRTILAAFVFSLVATAGTLPFMLLHFNRFSLLGPCINLLIEPLLCFWALPLGLLAIPWIFLHPGVAIVLLKTGGLAINGAVHLTRLGSMVPGGCLWTVTPTWLEIFGYGLLLGGCCLVKKFRLIAPVLVILALALGCSLTRGLWLPHQEGQTRVSFLDVGQGTAILIRLADGSTCLLDCGASRPGRFDVGRRLVAPYLWKQRIWRLDRVLITHPHQDHFNGMGFILSHFRPDMLYINGTMHGDRGYDRLLELARRKHIPVHVPKAGESIALGRNFSLSCLGMNGLPPVTPYQLNDTSLIVRLEHGNQSFLFPADISTRGESVLLDSGAKLGARILLAPHHGSRGSGSDRFIHTVAPGLIVISAGRYRLGTFPSREHLDLWQREGIQTWITGAAGSLTCSTDGHSLACTDVADQTVFSSP